MIEKLHFEESMLMLMKNYRFKDKKKKKALYRNL